MSLIKRMRKQDAVYWPPGGSVDQFGQDTLSTPVQIKCRWENVEGEGIQPNPSVATELSMTTVYVDRVLGLGGKLKLGTLESTDLSTDRDAWEIVRVDALPNIRATEFLRTVYLSRRRT